MDSSVLHTQPCDIGSLSLQASRHVQQADGSRASPAFGAAASAAQQALTRLSPCGLALLHLYAALGYEWGVQVLISSLLLRCTAMLATGHVLESRKHLTHG